MLNPKRFLLTLTGIIASSLLTVAEGQTPSVIDCMYDAIRLKQNIESTIGTMRGEKYTIPLIFKNLPKEKGLRVEYERCVISNVPYPVELIPVIQENPDELYKAIVKSPRK